MITNMARKVTAFTLAEVSVCSFDNPDGCKTQEACMPLRYYFKDSRNHSAFWTDGKCTINIGDKKEGG